MMMWGLIMSSLRCRADLLETRYPGSRDDDVGLNNVPTEMSG